MENELTPALLKKIDQYIKGGLNATDLANFENELLENEKLREEVRLQRQLHYTIGDKNWVSIMDDYDNKDLLIVKKQFESDKYKTTSRVIRQVGLDFKKQTKTKVKLYKYVASIAALFLIIISLFIINKDSNTFYEDNANWNEELPSFVEQNATINIFSKGEVAFKTRKYNEALQYFKAIEKNNQYYPYALMYLGATYELNDENDKALMAFDTLIALTSFEEHTRGYWYKLLIYSKLNDKHSFQKTINIILKNNQNYNYDKVKIYPF